MTIKLTATNLDMRFDERILFHIPTLSIGPNDAIYLTGANGVGKTTLLKILAGILSPSSGRLSADARGLFGRFFSRSGYSDVIYLHQAPYLFDGSVFQNVAYGLKYKHRCKESIRTKVIQALRLVALETLADEHISVLSGGERQRVAMARAWVLKPSILLMDEPSASLDQESVDRLVVMAQDLLDSGSSIVVTSHQRNPLTDLCKKQWSINKLTLTESPILQVVTSSKSKLPHTKVL